MTNPRSQDSSIEITPSTRFKAAPDQVSTELEGDVVILGLRSGGYFSLTNVGARIWALIQEPKTLEEVTDTIAAEYGEDPDVVEADAIEFLEHLTSVGLADVVD
jgi:hypothetical protein